MTEDEAKTKACPYAKNFGASQQVAEGPGPHCVASACMAWRTTSKSNGSNFYRDGYCGLAGALQ
ncbi:hypothetical protein [Caulobacter sp. RHG1]|uniref:hypothetical protein n=1 Tax=Caulobacter sp. (strain RHG1) TaxID=2545762 RepID=UPI0015561992|nr:hypothetical protein [Caulobacter sp. RHG1]NQE62914.1 hypothetical protein [Caulobacter sp. RHG1]